MVASKILLFLFFIMKVTLMTRYKGHQEMHFWIYTNKDVILAVKLLLLWRVVFTKENITISNIFVYFQGTYVTKVDYEDKFIHFWSEAHIQIFIQTFSFLPLWLKIIFLTFSHDTDQ